MGAEMFVTRSKGKTAEAAFKAAVDEALYEYGHRGYTSTIAEKDKFVHILVPAGDDPYYVVDRMLDENDENDERIVDKWGPAGCVELGDGEYVFFGWASS